MIAMVKKTSKVLYNFDGRRLDVKSIYRRLSKRRGRAQILSYVMISVSDISSKLFFVRDRRKKDWLVLISTNPEFANEEIVRLYSRRWDIELFFKMAKQHLKLVKEIQTRDFDSLVAHTSIVFVRVISFWLMNIGYKRTTGRSGKYFTAFTTRWLILFFLNHCREY